MRKTKASSPLRRLAAASAMFAAAAGAQAAPVTIKYLFNDAVSTSTFTNPGLDPSLPLPAELSGFTAWSDADGTLGNNNGQAGSDRAVSARSWHDGNSFLFSFDVAPGSKFDINQISFWQQGSSGAQGLGPTSWTMSINGQQVGSGNATRGNPGGAVSLTSGLPVDLTGTVAFSIFATGAENGTGSAPNATWRIDNFTITGDVAPVPVPAAAWLFGSALLGLAGLRRRAG